MYRELFDAIYSLMASALLGYCRIAPVFFLMPFLGSGNMPGVVRHPVIILVSIVLSPHYSIDFKDVSKLLLFAILAKEVVTGLFLACLLAFPFWVFHAIGNFIDNQRGATLSSTLDPATGVDASELARLFNLFSAAVYLNNGGMVLIMDALYQSYSLSSPFSQSLPNLSLMTGFLTEMMSKGIMLASPVIAVMLGAEVLLGVLSRFASQLNAFAVSLTIKSGLAFLMLLVYFGPVLSSKVMSISFPISKLHEYFIK